MNSKPANAEVTKSAPGPLGATYPICDEIPNSVGPVTAKLSIVASYHVNDLTSPVASRRKTFDPVAIATTREYSHRDVFNTSFQLKLLPSET